MCELAAAEVAKVEDEWRAQLGPKAYQQLNDALVALEAITDPYGIDAAEVGRRAGIGARPG